MARAKVILVDSDVISHFISAGHIYDLDKILSPHHLLIVEQVYKEATYHPWDDSRKGEVDSWLAKSKAEKISFPRQRMIVEEYYSLKHFNKRYGDGECACMAMAKYGKESIASSNFRDVAEYCDANGIEYIGVLDILQIALNKGIWDVEKCNKFIHDVVIINQARFPVDEIGNYKSKIDLSSF